MQKYALIIESFLNFINICSDKFVAYEFCNLFQNILNSKIITICHIIAINIQSSITASITA